MGTAVLAEVGITSLAVVGIDSKTAGVGTWELAYVGLPTPSFLVFHSSQTVASDSATLLEEVETPSGYWHRAFE
jgi:hypothetical protein